MTRAKTARSARPAEVSYVLTPAACSFSSGRRIPIIRFMPTRRAGKRGRIVFLGGFRRLEIPVADKRGRSAWPERFAPDKIEDLKRRTGPNKFASQMMLKPMSLAKAAWNGENGPIRKISTIGKPMARRP